MVYNSTGTGQVFVSTRVKELQPLIVVALLFARALMMFAAIVVWRSVFNVAANHLSIENICRKSNSIPLFTTITVDEEIDGVLT